MKVKYLGPKPIKRDNVAHTGVVWVGTGDVQEVPDSAWPKLAAHPTIWERVTDTHVSLAAAEPLQPEKPSEKQQEPESPADKPAGMVLVGNDGAQLDLTTLGLNELRKFIDDHQLNIPKMQKAAELRQAIFDLVKAQS